jgi:hypothetical protein
VLLGTDDGPYGGRTDFCTSGNGPASVAIGDLNGDGWDDLAVVNFSPHSAGRKLVLLTP